MKYCANVLCARAMMTSFPCHGLDTIIELSLRHQTQPVFKPSLMVHRGGGEICFIRLDPEVTVTGESCCQSAAAAFTFCEVIRM